MKMKRLIPILIIFSLLLSLCACDGNYAKVDLRKPVVIPEDGIIEKEMLSQIKDENAIATFTGTSGEFSYEWTIFGSDITEVRDVNLSVSLEKVADGIKVVFGDKSDFGFPALLSIYLSEKWTLKWETILACYVTGLPMDLIHGFGTVIFLMIAAEPMLEKMDRIKVKYGIAD